MEQFEHSVLPFSFENWKWEIYGNEPVLFNWFDYLIFMRARKPRKKLWIFVEPKTENEIRGDKEPGDFICNWSFSQCVCEFIYVEYCEGDSGKSFRNRFKFINKAFAYVTPIRSEFYNHLKIKIQDFSFSEERMRNTNSGLAIREWNSSAVRICWTMTKKNDLGRSWEIFPVSSQEQIHGK